MLQHLSHDSNRTENSYESQESHICTNIEELSVTDLIKLVDTIRQQNKNMKIENIVFERYLRRMDPDALLTMQQVLETANKLQGAAYLSSQIQMIPTMLSSRRLTTDSWGSRTENVVLQNLAAATSVMSLAQSQRSGASTNKVNLTQKIEIISRETDELQKAFDVVKKKLLKKRVNLEAQIEDASLRINESEETLQSFERTIVAHAIDPLTGKIPTEKLIRFMREWLRSADLKIEKLRLRTNTMRTHYIKLKKQLAQKKELGESLTIVDFEKIKIENKEYQVKIDVKNHQLLELKRMTGEANLMLSNHKKLLQALTKEYNELVKSVNKKKQQIIQLKEEEKEVENEMNKASHRLDQIKNLKENYTVPDIMEYIKKKAELSELNKDIKIWFQKKEMQQTTVSLFASKMKKITGVKNFNKISI